MQTKHAFLGAAVTAGLLLAASGAAQTTDRHAGGSGVAQPQYRIIDLGEFGGELANAHAINDAGHVVGTAEAPNLEALPFLWRDGALTDLGTLLPGRTSGHGIARGISSNGFVVGYSMAPYPPIPASSISHAFFWSEQSGMIDLTPDSAVMSIAWDVNSAGQVVGDIAGQSGGAFIWSAQTGIRLIGLPDAPPGYGGYAEGISDTGLVCGHQWDADFNYTGWIYNSATGEIRALGHLGMPRSETRGINNAGDVVGYSRRENFQQRPVLWTQDGEVVDLGFLPVADFTQGTANAINDDRWIVGADTYDGNGVVPKGWLWIAGTKFELRELIADEAERAEWEELPTPTGVNNRGEIVGIGIHNGAQGRAFLMRPLVDTIFSDGFDGE
jgi:probable HAF family extracellular repeat protein